MLFIERTLISLLALGGIVGCLDKSQLEPETPAVRPPLPTPPPGVLFPPGAPLPPLAPPEMPPPIEVVSPPPDAAAPMGTTYPETTFFVTSRGARRGGGDFRLQMGDADGLAGADALCRELAVEALATLGQKTWRAYLSTDTVNARDRIGTGPWRNARGIVVAQDLEQLHEEGELSNNLVITEFLNALDERGNPIDPARHDILTGSTAGGVVDPQGRTCSNWRSQSSQVQALVGHGDRRSGGGGAGGGGRSWNAAHAVGCGAVPGGGQGNRGEGTVSSNGGAGAIYCFAAD